MSNLVDLRTEQIICMIDRMGKKVKKGKEKKWKQKAKRYWANDTKICAKRR